MNINSNTQHNNSFIQRFFDVNSIAQSLFFSSNRHRSKKKITILYGSETGNSKWIAKQLFLHIKNKENKCRLLNIKHYHVNELKNEEFVFFIVSTHNQGDPAKPAITFFNELYTEKAIDLSSLHYSICGLGDSTYDEFCVAGKQLELLLENRNANNIVPRTDCDIHFKEDAKKWIESVLGHFSKNEKLNNKTNKNTSVNLPTDRKHLMTLKEKQLLTHPNFKNQTYHLEFELKEPLNYKPGDCIEIIPKNSANVVNQILTAINDGEEISDLKKQRIFDLLTHRFEVSRLTQNVIRKYASLSEDPKLQELLSDESLIKHYTQKNQVLDLLNDFPIPIAIEEILNILDLIHPRHYSITSSPTKHKNQLHLTIKTVQGYYENKYFQGAGSYDLNYKVDKGQEVAFRLITKNNFKLPQSSDNPILMIGTGTGISPYISFLNEREVNALKGKTWLIYGCRSNTEDNLYHKELQRLNSNGILKQFDIAFSRTEKTHVHDLLNDNYKKVLSFIEQGGHIYLCGHSKMAEVAENTLKQILMKHTNKAEVEAENFLLKMKNTGRLQSDLY